MEKFDIISVCFLVLGILFGGMGIFILVKKDARFIPNMTVKKAKKLKNIQKLLMDYVKRIIGMGGACLFTGLSMIMRWNIGVYVGGVLIVVAFMLINRFISSIDKRISEKVY